MTRSIQPRIAVARLAVVSACIAAGPASAAAIHGALFTTDVAGTVNVNQYESKTDVYLNGGPGPHAPCTAAGVDDGTYVFQITNPNGDTLLSTDDISHREFTVSGGVIISPANDHSSVAGDCGGIRVQMVPFNDTPNNGGVYKAWITRKSDYLANGNTFKPGDTKTDNFKVKVPAPPEVAALLVYKFYDANGNGVWDSTESTLPGWAMTASNGNGFNRTQLTISPDGLTTFTNLAVADNPYAVLEGSAGGKWVQSAPTTNGVPNGTPENPVIGITLVAGQTTEIDFGNYCTCVVKPYPTSYWLGSTGQTMLNDGTGMKPEFNLLNAANLRNATGGNFNLNVTLADSTNYNTLSAWMLGSSTTNMAYALSVQLATIKLNVDAGYVHPLDNFKPYHDSIAQLITDANALLSTAICGATCNTTAASQLRTDQETLMNLLADINDGATVILAKPCAYKFALPIN